MASASVRLVLIATHDRPGEYLLVDGGTRTVIVGPFHSDANPAVVAERIARRLNVEHRNIPIEWR
jgi:hypothetical protein